MTISVFVAVVPGYGKRTGAVIDVFEKEMDAIDYVEGWVNESCEWRGAEYVSIGAQGAGRVRGYVVARSVR